MVFWISSSYVGRDRKMQKRRQSAQNIAGGAGVDLPQGFVDEKDDGTTRHKLRRRTKPDEKDSRWMVYFVLFFIGVMGAGIFVMRKHDELQRQHLQNDVVEPLNMEWKEKVAELEARNEVLAKQAKDYLTMKEDYERITEELRQAGKLRQGYDNEVDYLKKYKKAIQGKIKRLSKTLLLEKFGPGPHRVEVNVQFPPGFVKGDESVPDNARIVLELAPIDEMPHTVYWFLEQVSRKLYDLTSFHRNAGHVMQGGPAKNFLTPPNSNLQQRFVDAGFKSVLFQEYSDKFPHKKYTVGYAGRPGGPDFYISMKDNSRLHGPGGQSSYEDPSEADPCFAKVIEGTDVAERMKLGQVKPGKYKALEDNVAIVSMRILSDNEGGVQVPDHVHDLPEGMDKNEGNEHVPDHVHDLPDGMEAESNK